MNQLIIQSCDLFCLLISLKFSSSQASGQKEEAREAANPSSPGFGYFHMLQQNVGFGYFHMLQQHV
jgi:hypothetical protein